MEVYFATKKLADTLSNEKQRVRAYGAVEARRILARMNQIVSAENLESLRNAPGGYHELRENRAGQLAVRITRNLRLVFKPTEDPRPAKGDGGLDWHAIRAITILEVTDYHGD